MSGTEDVPDTRPTQAKPNGWETLFAVAMHVTYVIVILFFLWLADDRNFM